MGSGCALASMLGVIVFTAFTDESASIGPASIGPASVGPASVGPIPPAYPAEIQPILKAKCEKCHGAETQKAEFALHTSALLLKGSESGIVLIPGKSGESRLFEVIQHREMPPKGEASLSEAEIDLVRRWIDAGADFGTAMGQQSHGLTEHDVIPILLLRCTACHGRHQQEGGLDLRNREAMLRGGKSGPAFVPGKPEDSLLLRRIHAEEMPPHSRLTEVSVKPMDPEETKILTRWIQQGAPLAKVEPELAGTPSDPLVTPEDRDFWSFQKPGRVAIPQPANPPPCDSPIDRFVLQKLQEQGLGFAPIADRLTLIRRISFDLTGLPPEPVESREFLADDRPDALDRVVDRLLASPRYGERWGNHWLDVAGYSETEGRREQHLPRPSAWRYRDYVIRSMNTDKPYDRFLQEQIAGDELADYERAPTITQEIEDNLVATAFLRLAPDPTWANLTGFVPDRLEVTADSIDVLGSGVMGLTFKCARCHTHKFDPIPQRDYYRLVALFKGAYDEHDWLKPQIIGYGGALSSGIGERFLSKVTTEERRRWEESQKAIQRQLDTLEKLPKTPETEKQIADLSAKRQPEPRIMALWDRGEPSPTYVYRRGNHATPGSYVTPGVPAILKDPARPFEIVPPWPGAKSTGRRLAFARWLTDAEQPLTARVMINRVWKHHFGQGIVRSLGNFGKAGERPTHPELLDYLAREFVMRGWSQKVMHRQLVLSTTYQQESRISEAAEKRDPRNQWLSRMPLRRLDAEELRDAILAVAGDLDNRMGGTSEPVQVRADGLVLTGRRRSIYLQQLRKHPPSLLEIFDLPAMNPNCLQRSDSLVATQALHLWNDTAIRQLAGRFADRVLSIAGEREQVEAAWWIAFGRAPAPDESAACIESIQQLTAGLIEQPAAADESVKQDARRRAMGIFCHTLLNSANFLYLD